MRARWARVRASLKRPRSTAFSDHDRLGFLRELRRYLKHCEREDLCAAGQLEPGRSVGGNGKGQQPEVVNRIAAPVGIVVLGAERLVPVPGVGEIVENHLPDFAALRVRQTRLHARRFGGDMLDDLVRRSTRLDCGTFHDEINCAQRQVLDIETIGDGRIVLEDYTSIEGQPRDRLGKQQIALLARQRLPGIALGHVHERDEDRPATIGTYSFPRSPSLVPIVVETQRK